MIKIKVYSSIFYVGFMSILLLSGGIFAQGGISKTTISLWEGKAPFAAGSASSDSPSIDVYLPEANPTRTGVIVIPGGAYHYLSDHEGEPVALWLRAHGVAAFVLHYRVFPYHYPAEMLDGQRAVRLVRSKANEYGIEPGKIGVWGFSAGGHLASYLLTRFNQPLMTSKDEIDAISSRPDFGILAYAVISMRPDVTHRGSHDALIGSSNDVHNLEEGLSNELHVSKDSPPAFIFATTDDGVVSVRNSLLFYEAYLSQKIPVEMHLFEHGSHGVVLAEKLPGASAWPDLLATWMNGHSWMAK